MTVQCAGCGGPIIEKTLLNAVDCFWHTACLNCSRCGLQLDDLGSSVFVRSNMLLCRQDYLKLFGLSGTCAKCRNQIPPDELVMRFQNKVYHLPCFSCVQCHNPLNPGDKVCAVNGSLFCEHEFPHLFSGQIKLMAPFRPPPPAESAPVQPNEFLNKPNGLQQQQHIFSPMSNKSVGQTELMTPFPSSPMIPVANSAQPTSNIPDPNSTSMMNVNSHHGFYPNDFDPNFSDQHHHMVMNGGGGGGGGPSMIINHPGGPSNPNSVVVLGGGPGGGTVSGMASLNNNSGNNSNNNNNNNVPKLEKPGKSSENSTGRKKQKKMDSRRYPPLRVC